MDEWLIRTVMALYTEACTVVRTDAGLSESFEVKVGLHQMSVLSPLLFAAVVDVVSSEARSDLPSELLYVDDLVMMAPTMEQPNSTQIYTSIVQTHLMQRNHNKLIHQHAPKISPSELSHKHVATSPNSESIKVPY